MKNKQKKPSHRLPLPRMIRFTVIGVFGILLLYSGVSAYTTIQTPVTKKILTPVLHYDHSGRFDYTAYLLDNQVYNNKTTLRPGEGVFFRQIIDHVNASFTDTFHIDQDADIQGNYSVDAMLKTTLWTKTYPVVPCTPFNAQGSTASFTAVFPLDYTYFEELLKKIDEETGVTAGSPQLVIRCTVVLSAGTADRTVSSVFSPAINMSLNQKTLEISQNLTSYLPGVLTASAYETQSGMSSQGVFWAAFSVFFIAAIPVFFFATVDETGKKDVVARELKRIKKKYGEWIVETNTRPDLPLSSKVSVCSLEDLSKVSEELGKPVLLYRAPNNANHRFYVIDEAVIYEYVLKPQTPQEPSHPLVSPEEQSCPACEQKQEPGPTVPE